MANMPMLSIVVPVYNAEKSLERCLDSIKEQMLTDYEVILIDDGSQDKSGAICDGYVREDGRFQVFHTENRGVSSARNAGLDQACGKYILFIDSDDSIASNYFQTFIEHVERSRAEVIIGGQTRIENGCLVEKCLSQIGNFDNEIWEVICKEPEIFGYLHGKIFRRSIISENNIRFNSEMYAQEDLDFNLSFYEKCERFETIDYAGYMYEYTSGKRKPPVWDFLANSLKMYAIASEKISLSQEAQDAVKKRIVQQIFAFLYNVGDKNEYDFAVEKLRDVSGLEEYLTAQKIGGEEKIVISWFLAGEYERIYRYFQARKNVKKILGRPVSE